MAFLGTYLGRKCVTFCLSTSNSETFWIGRLYFCFGFVFIVSEFHQFHSPPL